MRAHRFVQRVRRAGAILVASVLLMQGCSQEAPPAPQPRMVKVFVVGSSLESPTTSQMGVPFEKDPALPAFDVAGRVIAVLVQPGASVVEGQALMRLDPLDMALSESSARVQLAAAEAERDAAESSFKRFAELRQKGFISQAEFERHESEVKAARAKFEATSDALGYATLRALSAGVVQSVIAKQGMQVSPRQVVMTLQIGAQDRARLSRSRALRGTTPLGPVVPLASVIDGEAVYRLAPASDGLWVIEKVAITTGRITELGVEITSGLARGDRIVAAGTHVLSPGETVRPIAP